MTVCIAAIANDDDIICATDKKYTITHGITSVYEITENKKSIQMTPNCVALFSGDITHANAVLKLTVSRIKETDSIETVAKKIQNAYNEKLKEEINQQLLSKYSLDIDSFNQQQRSLDPTFVKTILDTVSKNGNLGIEIIIAGKNNGTPQLIRMQMSGALTDDTNAGYVCVGSGGSHAKLSMIESKCHSGMNLDDALFAVVKAKKLAEHDANVGKLTALVLISDKINFVDDDVVKKVMNEYTKASSDIDKITKKASKIIKDIAYAKSGK